MGVSILACNLDRTTPLLCTLKTDITNGQAGSYSVGYDIVMVTGTGPLDVILKGLTGSPNPLPSLWSTYSYRGDTDAHSYCKSYTVERDLKVDYRYHVAVNFEPAEPGEIPAGGGAPIKSEPNPLLRHPVFWWDREVFTHVAAIDKSGNTVRNYANNLYEELIEQERSKSQLVVEFNVANEGDIVDISRKYDQAVNETTWSLKERLIPDRSAMVREIIAGDPKAEGAYTYIPVSMRLAFSDLGKTFDVSKPEMGHTFYTKNGSGTYVATGTFRQRTDAGSLVPLNPDGTRRADELPVLVTDWRIRREADFSALPFMALL